MTNDMCQRMHGTHIYALTIEYAFISMCCVNVIGSRVNSAHWFNPCTRLPLLPPPPPPPPRLPPLMLLLLLLLQIFHSHSYTNVPSICVVDIEICWLLVCDYQKSVRNNNDVKNKIYRMARISIMKTSNFPACWPSALPQRLCVMRVCDNDN